MDRFQAIRVFAQVDESGSFSGAAEKLSLALPQDPAETRRARLLQWGLAAAAVLLTAAAIAWFAPLDRLSEIAPPPVPEARLETAAPLTPVEPPEQP